MKNNWIIILVLVIVIIAVLYLIGYFMRKKSRTIR